MKRLAVFASGNGSNAEAITRHLEASTHAVELIVSNNPKAGVLKRARLLGVKQVVFEQKGKAAGRYLVHQLEMHGIDAIALAGYLKLIPVDILNAYSERVWNIHPALLPMYGGKGMYGDRIHKRVLQDQVNRTGITIHQVNEEYDKGKILFQASFPVEKDWKLEELTDRIHRLEHMYYPRVLNLLLDELDDQER